MTVPPADPPKKPILVLLGVERTPIDPSTLIRFPYGFELQRELLRSNILEINSSTPTFRHMLHSLF